MSDFSMYHAMGPTSPSQEKRKSKPSTPQFRPPVAPSPGGYQQSGSSYGNAPPQAGAGGYFPPQGGPSPYQQQAQAPSTGDPNAAPPADSSGLMAPMAGMDINREASPAIPAPGRKKKGRHAHHDLQTPTGSSQAFNGIPQGTLTPGAQSQFLNSNAPQTPGGGFGQPPGPGTPMEQNAPLTGSAVSSSQGKVDPEHIPSIPRARDLPTQHFLDHVYPTMEHHLPPPAGVPFVAFDQGNASPKFARLTMNSIPHSSEALAATSLPLGLILQPLAQLQEGESAIPLLDFGEVGPPRCRRCRAYINPFMPFRSGGNKFICNMCTFPNDVAPEYFSATDQAGVRVDRAQRPELNLGTVEFTVPKEYWAKEPVGLRWLFIIDVTAESYNKGFVDAFCEGIISALYGTEGSADGESKGNLPVGAKVGIVTYDKEMHFYNLSAKLDQAQMLVMSDVEEPFVPLSEGLFVDVEESKSIITALLTQLPNMFSQVKNPEPALLAALNSGVAALANTGGKIVCSVGALPTWGKGRLFLRDDGKLHGTEGEKKLLTTEHPLWKAAANKMVEVGVGVDFFMAAPSGGYLDIATIGHAAAQSGGETFYYPNFHSPRDSLKLAKEIKHTVTRETGFQALMKVRCSNGLQVAAYHGNFTHHTFGADLEFGVIDADKAIGVVFSYDGKLDSKLDAHFQSALLYTTASGQRRVRCINLVASVSESAVDAMKFVDQDAVVDIIAREASSKVAERTLKDIRGTLTERTVDVLASYRKNFSGSHPPGQLVLPENLKEFGMYMLGLLKTRAFKGGREPSDRRVHDLRMIRGMSLGEMSAYLYPRIIGIHNLEPTDGFANDNGHLVMPAAVRASFSRVEDGGVYIVDNGQICLLWLHAHVSPNLLEDLFGPGASSLKDLDPFLNQIPVLDTHLNAQVRNILQYLEGTRGSKALTVQLARQGLDGAEFEFARLLVEDRNGEAQSYVDWLVHVHRHIQLELAGHRKKEESAGSDVMSNVSSTFAGLRTPYWG